MGEFCSIYREYGQRTGSTWPLATSSLMRARTGAS